MAFSLRTWILSGIAAALLIAVVCAFSFTRSAAPEFQPPPNKGANAVLSLAPTPKNIPAIAALLQSPDSGQAIAAAERLGQTRAPEAAPPLLAASADSRPPVQAAAINALARVQTKVDPAPFIQIVEATTNPAVRAAALDFLASQKAFSACRVMVKYLDDPDPEVRGRAYSGICALTCRDYSFRADDPPAKRQDAIRRIRASITFQ